MRRKSTLVLLPVVLFLWVCPAMGVIEFNDGLTHDIDYEINDFVYVDYQTPNMYTTVNVLAEGEIVERLVGWEDSRINVRGGEIRGQGLYSYDFSQVDISGGQVSLLSTHGYSQAHISGGLILSLPCVDFSQIDISGGQISSIYRRDSGQINISDGLISSCLYSYDSSQVNISGGYIIDIESQGSSQVNISNGTISLNLYSYDSSQINISGGEIGGKIDSALWLSSQSIIQIFGYDFAVDDQPFDYGELTSIYGGSLWDEPLRHLTGTLLNGGFINTDFRIGYDARIVLVPEPATVLLLGLGGLLLRSRRK